METSERNSAIIHYLKPYGPERIGIFVSSQQEIMKKPLLAICIISFFGLLGCKKDLMKSLETENQELKAQVDELKIEIDRQKTIAGAAQQEAERQWKRAEEQSQLLLECRQGKN